MRKIKATLSVLALSISLGFSTKASASVVMSDVAVAGISYSYDKYIEATISEEVTSDVEATQLSTKAEKKSKYENYGFSIADNYVNIRSKASTDSEVLGKLQRGSVAKIQSYEGDWAKIKSGKVEGYIKTEFLAIGKDAEKYADEFTEKYATINTETLFVREKASTDAKIITMVPIGETFYINKEYDEWVNIMIDESESGFVSKQYITIELKYKYAMSIEEEKAKLAAEQAAKEAEEKQQEALKREQEAASKAAAEQKASASSQSLSNKSSATATTTTTTTPTTSSSSSKGQQIASYAKQFVGNPYIYGGTSLTNGADCSGFVQSIFKHFGYSLTRVSSDQARSAGKAVSISNLQPGDLVFYSNGGGVNHVAIYIGNGKVVHASNARDGIKISSYNYRTPHSARRVI